MPGGYVTHTCENHEEMLRIVVETRNDVKHLVRHVDCMSTKMDSQINQFEQRASAFSQRVDNLEKTRDEQAGAATMHGQFSAAIAFIISLVVSILAVAIPWLASR
jgi:hypothetical protein